VDIRSEVTHLFDLKSLAGPAAMSRCGNRNMLDTSPYQD
jgi:hypothetical protein